MKKDKIKSFLGTGWGFPPTFDRKTKGVNLLTDVEDINSSLDILLSTKLGERVMVPNYGCNLEDLVFESLDIATETFITELIRTAILYHEPRIDLESVEYIKENRNEGIMLIKIDYTVRSTNSRSNFVYPFYKEEANNL
jgi:phage baseplate assembly protein W